MSLQQFLYNTELPTSIGHLKTLRKLMLAGNQLHSLPVELSYCKELELLRIAANNLTVLPTWLFDMPRLSWFAYAGNPIETHSNSSSSATAKELREVPYAEIVIGECIGEGASGFVHKAVWSRADSEPTPVAVKLFKGETTSDGLPVHEMEVRNNPLLAISLFVSFTYHIYAFHRPPRRSANTATSSAYWAGSLEHLTANWASCYLC